MGGILINKISILSIIILTLVGSSAMWSMASTKTGGEDGMKSIMVRPLPDSLDKWYEDGPVYLFRMFGLAQNMTGIVVNTEQGDKDNANIAYQNFLTEYQQIREMVPEWKHFYDVKAVEKVGKALETGDKGQILAAMGPVFQTCSPCHVETKTKVWAKYHWKDFNTVMMKTVDPSKNVTSWKEAKSVYLLSGFDGTIVNARENQKDATFESFQLFKAMFQFMNESCTSCHETERGHYVSEDVMSLIEKAEEEISNNELNSAAETMEVIGGTCFDCHQTHEPIQRLVEQQIS